MRGVTETGQFAKEIRHIQYTLSVIHVPVYMHLLNWFILGKCQWVELVVCLHYTSSSINFNSRWTSLWAWTVVTFQTLWRTWSGSAKGCLPPRMSSCTAVAPTRTQTSLTLCSCSAAPLSTSSTSSSHASLSPSWPLWVSTCLQTLGRRFPSE